MKLAIIGYGEVGSIFARDLVAAGAEVTTFDADSAAQTRAGPMAAPSPAAALAGAEIVIVAVTAAAVPAAMQSLTSALTAAPLVLDVNSVSPATKQAAAATIDAAGGRYVEAAVMVSVPPKGLRSRMLLGGPHAPAFVSAMAPFAMDLTVFSDQIGRASSVKMCRSVMVKGLESLVTECMLAARHYGVEADVLATLNDTLPHDDWPKLARYVISRALIHGKRRAEEMREVAITVTNAGVEPLMSRAIVERQEWAWRQGIKMGPTKNTPDLEPLLEALTKAIRQP